MSLKTFYQQRVTHFETLSTKYSKQSSLFQFLRLGSLLLSPVLLFTLWDVNLNWAILSATLSLAAFIASVAIDIKLKAKAAWCKLMMRVNEHELLALNSNYTPFPTGIEFINKNHPYAADLDLFGNTSLFRMICRSNSGITRGILARWLTTPLDGESIAGRQAAIEELKGRVDWRQSLYARELEHPGNPSDLTKLFSWLDTPSSIAHRKYLLAACRVLPFIAIASIAGSFFVLPLSVPITVGLIHAVIIFVTESKVRSIHTKLSGVLATLQQYAHAIRLSENEQFESAPLNTLKANLFHNGMSVSKHIQHLSQLLDRLDYRCNILAHTPLNFVFFWDIIQVKRLEDWKSLNGERVKLWFETVGELTVYSFFANLLYNNPSWILPSPKGNYPTVEGKNLGHPLIKPEAMVCNDINMSGRGKIMLVTGSNMAGKSTYLRTVGINLVLANIGSPVCATHLTFSPMGIFTSMRVNDSLEENISSFYAELARIKVVVEQSELQHEVLFLLDEILRGTNSNDRHMGSRALIKQLVGLGANALIATHDLALTHMEQEYPLAISNHHFDVQINGCDELYFSYKLNSGVCKSLNASILMRKMGIRLGEEPDPKRVTPSQ